METRGGERFRILFRVKVDSGSWLIIFAPLANTLLGNNYDEYDKFGTSFAQFNSN